MESGESMRVRCRGGADTRVHWERGVVRREAAVTDQTQWDPTY